MTTASLAGNGSRQPSLQGHAIATTGMNAVVQQGLTKTQILQNYGCVVGGSDVSLQVRLGDIFCIMGLSGIGKSTLIRLLNKLITPSAGKIVVKGKDLLVVECSTTA